MALTTAAADWSRVTARCGTGSWAATVAGRQADADEPLGDATPHRVDSVLRWRLLRPAGL